MGEGSWTELFFLDEATALAAGHRPCFLCRRAAAEAFRRYGLADLFQDVGSGRHHQAIKPTGYDYDADAVIPEAMARWRANYRALPEPHQMMAATIVWLYRGGLDTVWLRRVAVAWSSAHAIKVLRKDGALADWGLLIALYPGW
jgi:hypothetical protein